MSTWLRAAWHQKVGTFPLSWSWGSYVADASGFESIPLVIAPAASVVRRRIRPDMMNNPNGVSFAQSAGEPCNGFEESYSFNVVSAGAVVARLVREFSINEVAFFLIDTTNLAVAAGPAGATTNNLVASTLRRFPAYPFLRYTIFNDDPVNAITLNFLLTLRAS